MLHVLSQFLNFISKFSRYSFILFNTNSQILIKLSISCFMNLIHIMVNQGFCFSTLLQINFIACQFLAVILSFILKKYVKHPRARLMYCLISGICICNFCFGVQIFHVLISAGLSFVLIRYCCRSTYMPWLVWLNFNNGLAYYTHFYWSLYFIQVCFYRIHVVSGMAAHEETISGSRLFLRYYSPPDGKYLEL